MKNTNMVCQNKNLSLLVCDHLVAIFLALMTLAGPFKFLYGLDNKIYYLTTASLFFLAAVRFIIAPTINKNVAFYIAVAWFLFFWLIISITWTSSDYLWKEDLYMIINLLAIVTLSGFLLNQSTIGKYLYYFISGALLISLFVLKETGNVVNISGYGTKVNDAYLTLALPQGMALAISVFHFANSSLKMKLLWFLLGILFIAGLGVSLARGPLVFSVFAIIVISFFCLRHYRGNFHEKNKKFVKSILGIMVIICALSFIVSNVQRTASRFARMTNILNELSDGKRGEVWVSAWELIGEAPILGNGLGMSHEIAGPYPHNLFLQVWIDGGITAVLLLFLLILLPVLFFLKTFKYHYKDPKSLSLFAIIIILTLEFSKSGDFYRARPLIIALILGFSYISLMRKNSPHRTIQKTHNGRKNKVVLGEI